MKKITIPLIAAVIFCMTTSIVLAVNYGNYYPLNNNKVVKLFKDNYYTARGEKGKVTTAAHKGLKAIKPHDARFHYGVISDGNTKSKVISGKTLSNATAQKIADRWKSHFKFKVASHRHYWFNASAKPEVEYSNYRIYDEAAKKYIKLRVRAKLIGYSKSNLQKEAKGLTPAIAFMSDKTGVFDGLPDIIIAGIGTAHVRYTFYNAETGAKYPIKQNVTYLDIDDAQAVSVRAADAGGFTATNNVNLKFGKAVSDYYAVQSNSFDAHKEQDERYWMSYNLNGTGGTIDMLYTSNQKKIVNGAVKKSKGKPNGAWSHFFTSTYTKKPPTKPAFPAPYKRVYDNDGTDDVYPKGHNDYGKYNKLKSTNQTFNYRIYQKIPGGLKWGTDWSIDTLQFKDTVDDCLNITNASVMLKYNEQTIDISKHFNIKKLSNYTYTATLKNTKVAHNAIYKPKNCIVYMRVDTKVVKTLDQIANHADLNEKTLHRPSGKNQVNISDIGNVTRKMKSEKQTSLNTNIVHTRLTYIPKHDLVVRKQVSGENPDRNKKFTFNIFLNNGSNFTYTIRRANGTVDTFTGKFNKTGKEVTLSHDEVLTIKEIQQDITYTITEVGHKQYKPNFYLSNPGNCLSGHSYSGSAAEGRELKTSAKITRISNNNPITYTFTNERVVHHHNLTVIKKISGGSTNDVFEYTLNVVGASPNTTYATSVGNKTTNANGDMNIAFNLKANQSFYINRLPDSTKYRITEAGKNGYKPSYKVTTGEIYVTGKAGNSEYNKALSTANEQFIDRDMDYNVGYTFTNRKIDEAYAHDLILTKKIEGTDVNKEDSFEFTVKFENIPRENNEYHSIGAELYTWVGEKDVFDSIAEKVISHSTHTETVSIKAGQYVIFNDIPEGVKYTVTEEKSDYTSRYSAFKKNINTGDTMSKWSDSNTKPHTTLSDTKTLDRGVNTETTYTYINKKDKEPIYNKLSIGKVTTDGANKEFNFTLKLSGLNDQPYALFGEGDTEYILINDENDIRIRSGRGTLGDPYKYAAGVPITITRTGGDQKVIYTSETANGNFAAVKPWIDYKGGDYSVSWIGTDKYVGEIITFTAKNGQAEVNFTLSNDKEQHLWGIPQEASYTVKELANIYDPSYTIMRDKVKIDYANGKLNEDFTTRKQTFNQNKETNDKVTFRNNKESYMLRTNKVVTDMSDKLFDFMAEITGLSNDKYMSMVPGEGDFEIQMTPTGIIKLVARNYSDSIENIPIKLIRPCDNAEKVFYTDANGEIIPNEFIGWLSKEQKGDYKFTLEWNGGRVSGSFDAE